MTATTQVSTTLLGTGNLPGTRKRLFNLTITLLCSAAATSLAAETPTYSADIALILNENCVICHREGEIGPMPLTRYEEVLPFAALIADHTTQRIMPPWGANPDIGEFANDPSLSETEIATIAAWVAGGAPLGNAEEIPPVPEFNADWRMENPDVVLVNPESFTVEPVGRSVYQNAMIDPGFTQDAFITGAEVRPALQGYTHHANVYATLGSEEHRVAGYTPGGAIRNYPEGVAKLIPANTQLRLNMHYNPKGQTHVDPGTAFAFKLAAGPVHKIAYTAQTSNRDIDIPPGEANYELRGQPFEFSQDSHIISFMPRMNERGKAVRYVLRHPDGSEEVLLDVPQFHFGWIFTYELAEPVPAPAGSQLYSIALWDNSTANPHNPDASARVGYGPEILNAYFEYTLDAQDLSREQISLK